MGNTFSKPLDPAQQISEFCEEKLEIINNKIKKITFPKVEDKVKFIPLFKNVENQKGGFVNLFGMNVWNKVPSFVVITSKNGAGKTQLFGYIQVCCEKIGFKSLLSINEVSGIPELIKNCHMIVNRIKSNNYFKKLNEDLIKYGLEKIVIDGNDNVDVNICSHGELVFLYIIALSHIHNMMIMGIKVEGLQPYQILLLDEIDAAFDPKLTKKFIDLVLDQTKMPNGIQVIMTTHRIDTIALAPEGSIFTIEQNEQGIAQISQTHPLLAMFRLTSNLRELTNIHTKVYTESHDDALFYEGSYKALMLYSNNIRKAKLDTPDGQNKQNLIWQRTIIPSSATKEQNSDENNLTWQQRVLSKRYGISFYSCALAKADSGGGDAVEYMISRDIESRNVQERIYAPKDKNESIEKWMHRVFIEVTIPYAIIDGDYGLRRFQTNDPEIKNRFAQLKRHSVENFLFDPFILLSSNKLEQILDNDLKTTCNRLKINILSYLDNIICNPGLSTETLDKIQHNIEEYTKIVIFKYCQKPNDQEIEDGIKKERWSFRKIDDPTMAQDMAVHLTKEILDKIKSLPKDAPYDRAKHFDMLLKKSASEVSLYKKLVEDSAALKALTKYMVIDEEDRKQFHRLCDKVKPERLLQYKNIEVAKAANNIYSLGKQSISIILSSDHIIKVIYPEIFLKLRGHDIEDTFPVGNRKDFKNSIINGLYNGIYVPSDLAEIFFELNLLVREQMNLVTKHNQLANLSKNQLKLKGYSDSFVKKIHPDESTSPITGTKSFSLSESLSSPTSSPSITSLSEKSDSNLDTTKQQDMRKITLSEGNTGAIIRIKGDGNCLFRAIVEGYNVVNGKQLEFMYNHIGLRAKVVEKLRENENKESIKIILSSTKECDISMITESQVEKYINDMAGNGIWAGDMEITIIAKLLERKIVVHHNNGSKLSFPPESDYSEWPILLELKYENVNAGLSNASGEANHYNLVVSIELAKRLIDTATSPLVMMIASIEYTNPLINSELLYEAQQIGGVKAINNLIDLGENKDLAEQILLAIDELGVDKVLEIFFGDITKTSESEAVQIEKQEIIIDTHSEQILETIAKIESIIGKEALTEIAGYYQLVSTALSNNPLSNLAAKVLQIMGDLISNLEEYLDLGNLYESIDIDNQVAIILTQLEHWVDFAASGHMHIGMSPRHPGFGPDFDPSGGFGGGGQGMINGTSDGNHDAQGVTLFIGHNVTTFDA
jgi:hypothetical protein